jgi:2-succinyl-5-enolpyruvyl-6-hydroxy-3-cyclohexene-1-carboxylate synthase
MAFVSEPRIDHAVILDERSAGFFALGMAKQSGFPVALICSSGTAAANYLPAVVEASHARVPLLVMTADRPPELRGVAAPQTIDQVGLYGSAARLFHDVGVPDASVADGVSSLALRAWSAALDVPPGPVHLNFPFREPLAAPTRPAPPSNLQHHRGEAQLPPEALVQLADHLSGRKALIVAGGRQRPGFAPATAMLAGEAAIPVVTDIQCRFPSPSTIAHADLLATAGFFDEHPPDVVVRVGPVPTSRPIWSWLERADAEQITVDDARWRDSLGTASGTYRADPAVTFADLAGRLTSAPPEWLALWQTADRGARRGLAAALDSEIFPNEPAIARAVWEAAPGGATIYAGSSMPIRDLDSFSGAPRGDVEVLANRGANGIDGLLSAATGAAASDGRPVIVLAGDLSVFHDVGALGTLADLHLPVTIIAVNNDGGGIFHFLPQAGGVEADRFETVFGTPHGRSLVPIAEAFGIPSHKVEVEEDLRRAVAHARGPALVEIETSRFDNVAVHDRLREAVRDAVR